MVNVVELSNEFYSDAERSGLNKRIDSGKI